MASSARNSLRSQAQAPSSGSSIPIDGTRAFITGMPLWGTLIGLVDAGMPVLGLINQPYTGERFWCRRQGVLAEAGAAPKRLKTGLRRLAGAVLTTTHPDMFSKRGEQAAFQTAQGAEPA